MKVDRQYKVAVWATGGIGKYAIRTIADRPNLDLVGVWVHSDDKNGKDAGELAGIDSVGVLATQDAAEILDSNADCIVYAAPAPQRMKEAIGDLCRILAAGKNIVTTSISGLVYPRGSMPSKVIDKIRSAAEAGRSSLFSSGIEPGFGADLFPIALMSMSHNVYSVRGIEITNYSEYGAEYDMRELFGFGQPLDYQGGLKVPGTLRWGWGAAVTMSPTHWGSNSTTSAKCANFSPPRATSPPRSDSSKPAPSAPPGHAALVLSTARTSSPSSTSTGSPTTSPPTGSKAAPVEPMASGGSLSTESRASTRNSKSGIFPARATTITACWPRACARSTPYRGSVTLSPESWTRCTSRSPHR
jgi:Dihydrodipicolinate reductase, N-terminus